MRQPVIPASAYPHEGREYELLACARKRIALFEELIPERFVHNPLALPLEQLYEPRLRCTIYYMPGARNDAEFLLCLLRMADRFGFDEHVHRHIGKLLGYKDSDIDRFVANIEQCDKTMPPTAT